MRAAIRSPDTHACVAGCPEHLSMEPKAGRGIMHVDAEWRAPDAGCLCCSVRHGTQLVDY